MPAKPSVFISYRRQPAADLARYLHHRLTTHRYDVFLDVETINGGRFANIIRHEIINRDVFVVILTPETLQSEWVVREIKTALDHQKPIIPLAAQGFSFAAPLPDEIKDLSDYDAIRWDNDFAETAFERLVKAIDPNYKANARPIGRGIAVLATVLIILAIIVALLVPGVLQPASVPTQSPAPTTAIPFVDTPTGVQIMNLDTTATEIFLQRTVDAKETANSQSFAESTQIAATAYARLTATKPPLPNTTATRVIDFGATATEAILQRTVVALGVINATLLAENTRIVEASTLTASPPPTPSKTPAATPTPSSTSGLVVGGQARVRLSGSGYNLLEVRSAPDELSLKRVELSDGTVVTILDGPTAGGSRLWWRVRTSDGIEGWAPEALGSRYQTLMPIQEVVAPTTTLTSLSTAGLVLDGQARIRLSGSSNILFYVRSAPDELSLTRAELREGAVVTILDGPVASDIFLWWRVRTSDGIEGWAQEALGDGFQTLMPIMETPAPTTTPR